MTTWRALPKPGQPGCWTLRFGGVDAGDLALDHPYATFICSQMVAAANDALVTLSAVRTPTSPVTVPAGWESLDEHDEALDAIRMFTTSLPGEVRALLDDAWSRTGWNLPMTRDQMDHWTTVVEAIIETAPAAEPLDEVAA